MVGGGHGEALLPGLAGEIMGVVNSHGWLQVPGCSGWCLWIVKQCAKRCQCDRIQHHLASAMRWPLGINLKTTAFLIIIESMNPILIVDQETEHIPLGFVATFEPDNFGRLALY